MIAVTLDLNSANMKHLRRQMDMIPKRMRRRCIKAALRDAYKIYIKEAKARCPKGDVDRLYGKYPHKKGNLRRSISFKWLRAPQGSARVIVGPRSGKNEKFDGYYGKFVEQGTSKLQAKPFMKPAFLSKKGAMEQAIERKLEQGLYG